MHAAALVLLLQVAGPSPCPPSLRCPLPVLQTVSPVTVLADPNRPAQWFSASEAVALAAFELWALETNHHTVSQWSQQESAAHPLVRWALVSGMALLTLHLAWHGPLW